MPIDIGDHHRFRHHNQHHDEALSRRLPYDYAVLAVHVLRRNHLRPAIRYDEECLGYLDTARPVMGTIRTDHQAERRHHSERGSTLYNGTHRKQTVLVPVCRCMAEAERHWIPECKEDAAQEA